MDTIAVVGIIVTVASAVIGLFVVKNVYTTKIKNKSIKKNKQTINGNNNRQAGGDIK